MNLKSAWRHNIYNANYTTYWETVRRLTRVYTAYHIKCMSLCVQHTPAQRRKSKFNIYSSIH